MSPRPGSNPSALVIAVLPLSDQKLGKATDEWTDRRSSGLIAVWAP